MVAATESQLALSFPYEKTPIGDGVGITFRDSKRAPFHRWYPYVQGFAYDYVREVIQRFRPAACIYDPFGGAGTTQLEASMMGIASTYSEINPFMRFVAETKINSSIWAKHNASKFEKVATGYLKQLECGDLKQLSKKVSLDNYTKAFRGRDFFEERHLRELLAARDLAVEVSGNSSEIRSLLLLAVAANVVHASHMTRRSDLRRRRANEYKTRVVNVTAFVSGTLQRFLHDLASSSGPKIPTQYVCGDARDIGSESVEKFDLSVTSPPYLNGTNYCRNTKLELWFMGWLTAEIDLREFRRVAITAGINNVTKSSKPKLAFEPVEAVAARLDTEAQDQRIPAMVRAYFSDMFDVFTSVKQALKSGARFVVDIGDSKFYGTHVPTDSLLRHVAEDAGFKVESQTVLARRYSYDKTELKQIELVLRKPDASRLGGKRIERVTTSDLVGGAEFRVAGRDLAETIRFFRADLPYKAIPFRGRNWGHPLHSLCSYQGKLKPAIAHWLVKSFTAPGMKVWILLVESARWPLRPAAKVGLVLPMICRPSRSRWQLQKCARRRSPTSKRKYRSSPRRSAQLSLEISTTKRRNSA